MCTCHHGPINQQVSWCSCIHNICNTNLVQINFILAGWWLATKPCANLLSDVHSVSFRKRPSTSATPRISSVTTWMSLSSTSPHWSVQTTPPTCTLVMAETHVLFRNPWASARQTLWSQAKYLLTKSLQLWCGSHLYPQGIWNYVWIPPVPSGDLNLCV